MIFKKTKIESTIYLEKILQQHIYDHQYNARYLDNYSRPNENETELNLLPL